MSTKRKQVDDYVDVEVGGSTRDELVADIDKAIESIPEPYRDTAHFDLEKEYDYGDAVYCRLRCTFKRDETDEERAARVKQENTIKEVRRRQYEALKAEFEGKK